MSQAARKNAAANSHTESAPAPIASRGQKTPVFLVTQDDALWPQIGQGLDQDWTLKQVDSVDELQRTTNAGQAGIIVWDAREQPDCAGDLSRLQLHSARFAIIVLDDAAASTEPWRVAIQQRQIVALLGIPFDAAQLLEAFASACDEYHARSAVLGEGISAAPAAGSTGRNVPRLLVLIAAAVCMACAGAYLWYRHSAAPVVAGKKSPAALSAAPAAPTETKAPGETSAQGETNAAGDTNGSAEEQVDSLLEKARQAMLDRHYIEPAGENALTLYQNVLIYDPNNGEARQGLQRLAQILFARVQSDLDDRKFDMALQALETARSIDPDDSRLAELDARIESLRAEFGPAQIQAALNAKNFDRATQLLDEAARAKSLNGAKLNQLREELRRRQAESDVAQILKLLATRTQQERLLEPHEDSAVYYLQQARDAGASAADLQQPSQALSKKLMQAARAALDQHRLSEAERLLGEARNAGAAPKALAGLQRDFDGARESQAHEKAIHSQILALAQTRLAQGSLLQPDNDNALFYVNQLRAADPSNSGLAQVSGSLQSAIVTQARSALESGDMGKAESLLKAGSGLGSSTELDNLAASIAQQKQKQGKLAAAANSLIVIKPLKLEYPRTALANGTEGWVDLAFLITTEGKVSNITVLDASPPNVFDSAAKSALSRVRYKPVLVDGQAIAIKTTLHVVFRLAQQ